MRPLRNSFALLCTWAAVASAQSLPSMPVDAAWLDSPEGMRLEIARLGTSAAPENREDVILQIEALVEKAEDEQNEEASAEGRYWLLVLMLEEDDVADVGEEFTDLLRHCQTHFLHETQVATLRLRATWLNHLNREMEAARDLDLASQHAFAGGASNNGVQCLLDMVGVFRQLDHPWRARQAWTRLEIALLERGESLNAGTLALVAEARRLNANILALTPAVESLSSIVELQPAASQVSVSSTSRNGAMEKARARFCLSNPSSTAATGELALSISAGTVSRVESIGQDLLLEISPSAAPSVHKQKISLRPGQQLFAYLEHLPGEAAGTDALTLTWSDANSVQNVSAHIRFEPDGRQSCVVNASKLNTQSAFPAAFYHEIYYRGDETHAENVHIFSPGNQARLEIYDQDTGELLAVDENGDGAYDGENDWLAQDHDGNGHLDLVLGPKRPVGSLEIYAFPLHPKQKDVRISLSLIEEGNSGPAWRKDAEDALE